MKEQILTIKEHQRRKCDGSLVREKEPIIVPFVVTKINIFLLALIGNQVTSDKEVPKVLCQGKGLCSLFRLLHCN